ncbi:MAG: 50S ribosomal protein L17 [Clostridia bacterium]|nr:50S ribosomal protein L17 [Clostridia bacterium]
MANRKLGRSVDQRAAILRSLTTALIWNGKIVTTEARAKEVRSIAEKLITLAVKEYKNTETVEKESRNEKSQVVTVEKNVDKPSKLAARRQIMSYLYDIPEQKAKDENKAEYKKRTAERTHPVVEKLFQDIAPRVDKRIEEGKKGGYTRMYKLGARRGDAAEMVVLEII